MAAAQAERRDLAAEGVDAAGVVSFATPAVRRLLSAAQILDVCRYWPQAESDLVQDLT